MLMGEHAVVYGGPCIVTAVDQRLTVRVEKITERRTIIDAPQVTGTRFVDTTIEKFFSTVGKKFASSGISMAVFSQFSNTVGFGSSSAVTVAAFQALCLLFDISISKKQLFDYCFACVTTVQGVGSGFDIAAAIYGGTLLFRKGGETIEPVRVATPLVVGYSGTKADTVSLVKRVGDLYKKYPEKMDRLFEGIGKLVLQGQVALEEKDWKRLGTLFNFNQEYLRDLGVSTEKLEALISAAKDAGAYGAKLSGAGGGDCMIALVSEKTRISVAQAITQAGGQVMNIQTNAPGVRQETTDDQQELFIVVDKNDNILGYKTRYECHHDRTLTHRSVGILIFDDTGRVLLQQRSATKDLNPLEWSTSAAGHVTKGESYEEAANRELFEELGVRLPIQFKTKHFFSTDQETERGAIYIAHSNGPFVTHPQEIDHVEFMTRDQVRRGMKTGGIVMTPTALEELTVIGFLP